MKKKEGQLSKEKIDDLLKFFEQALSERVSSVKVSPRMISSPAIIVDHESAAVRRMRHLVEQFKTGLPKQKLEINPNHSVMIKLSAMKATKPDLAKIVAEQIFDNALISADILENPRTMLNRLNRILDETLTK